MAVESRACLGCITRPAAPALVQRYSVTAEERALCGDRYHRENDLAERLRREVAT
jgi:hypothetical protein